MKLTTRLFAAAAAAVLTAAASAALAAPVSAAQSVALQQGATADTKTAGFSIVHSTAGEFVDTFTFSGIDRWGNLAKRALTPQAVNLILKRRAAAAGLDPAQFSAHGLRSGYLTETARRGIPLPEAMQQSQHRSVQQAASYYNEAERTLGQAARLIV